MTNDPVTQSPRDSSLALHLLSMALGVAQTAVLCTAAQLGLADHVKDGPRSVAALAEATGTHLPTLTRLMDVLVHLGLFRETAPGQFTCTPLGALLQTDAPQSVRHFVMLIGGEWYGPTWPHLVHSVRTGTSAFESVVGTNVYNYFSQHPAALAVFQQTMSDLSADEGLAVRDAYDFARCQTVVDLGGGRGGLLAILLQAFPSLQGILFDLPVVVEGAQAAFQTEPCGDGVSSSEGIFWRQCRQEATCISSNGCWSIGRMTRCVPSLPISAAPWRHTGGSSWPTRMAARHSESCTTC